MRLEQKSSSGKIREINSDHTLNLLGYSEEFSLYSEIQKRLVNVSMSCQGIVWFLYFVFVTVCEHVEARE